MSQSNDDEIDPMVALRKFLSTIENQAEVDASFRNNLLLALGVKIVFSGEDDLTTIEPHIVAAKRDELQFRAIYSKLPAAKLRSTLTKSKLASTADLRQKTQEQMLTMLWERASARAEERGLKEAP